MTPALAAAVLAGACLGVGLWCLLALAPVMRRPRLVYRVAPYVRDVSAGARDALRPPPPGPLPVVGLLLAPLVEPAQRLLGGLLGGSETVALRLRQSGSPLTVDAFRLQQLLCGLAGCAQGAALGVAAGVLRGVPFPIVPAATALLGVGGVVLRDWMLQRSARRRLERLLDELPVLLEFMTLSLSAGEGVFDAVRRVARSGSGELAGELAGVASAVGTGRPFAESLRALAADLQLAALTRCVDQMVGALERGSPLTGVLRAQVDDARTEAKRRLLESAGRKEVAMLVPLVFLILPVTVLFALFPGVMVLQTGF